MSWRPWTQAAARLRRMRGNKRKLPEKITRWNIVKGDLVSYNLSRDSTCVLPRPQTGGNLVREGQRASGKGSSGC